MDNTDNPQQPMLQQPSSSPSSNLEDRLRSLILRNQQSQQPPSETSAPDVTFLEQTPMYPPIPPQLSPRRQHMNGTPQWGSPIYNPMMSYNPNFQQQSAPTSVAESQGPLVGSLQHYAATPVRVPLPSNNAFVGQLPPHLRASKSHSQAAGTPPSANSEHFPALGSRSPQRESLVKSVPQNTPNEQKSKRPRFQPLRLDQQPYVQQDAGSFRHTYPRNNHAVAPRSPQALEHMTKEQAQYLTVLANRICKEEVAGETETNRKYELLAKLRGICSQRFPGSDLVPFGSFVTGFATSSSDIDVVFTLEDASALVTDNKIDGASVPEQLETAFREAGFQVQLLTRTRVPIIKLTQKPENESDLGLQCDIGFNNNLAIHNSDMLLTYSRCDARVKQMVVFVKWWAKRRRINSPYRGTLSSYGWALMVLHYLINIASPPVLSNLQTLPWPNGTKEEEKTYIDEKGEHNIWYAKDVENLKPSTNQMSIGAMIREFFDYYAYKFVWGQSVISIRTTGGLLSKQEKGWVAAVSRAATDRDGENWEVKDRYLFAVEDPFEIHHNVGRTCTMHGVRRIRDELRRAMRIIRFRDGGKSITESLCMEAPPDRPFIKREDRPGAVQNPNEQDVQANEDSVDSTATTEPNMQEKTILPHIFARPNQEELHASMPAKDQTPAVNGLG